MFGPVADKFRRAMVIAGVAGVALVMLVAVILWTLAHRRHEQLPPKAAAPTSAPR